MALTRTERMALDVLKARINPRDPGHSSRVIPKEAQPYIDTWILPLIDYLEGNDRRPGDVEDVRQAYLTMTATAHRKKVEQEARDMAQTGRMAVMWGSVNEHGKWQHNPAVNKTRAEQLTENLARGFACP